MRGARGTCQFFVILDFRFEAVLKVAGSDEFVDELLSPIEDEFDVVAQFFDDNELIVIHGREVGVKMWYVRLIFTGVEDETIAETAELRIIRGIF